MKKNELKNKILKEVKKFGDISLPQLTSILGNDVKGNHLLLYPTNDSIVLAADVTKQYANVLNELKNNKEIEFLPTSVLVTMMDGVTYNLPIAKDVKRKYKSKHWLPLLVKLSTINNDSISIKQYKFK